MERRRALIPVWIASALTLPAELLAGARADSYDWVGQTISELGATRCLTSCSPAHALLNGAMVVAGLCLTIGAVWLTSALPAGWARWATAACAGLVGLSTAATGLVPLDVDPELHVLVSVPALALACVPVLLLARVVLPGRPVVRGLIQVLALVGLAAGVVVACWLEAPWPGLLERLAVWPSTVFMAAAGASLVRSGGAVGPGRQG